MRGRDSGRIDRPRCVSGDIRRECNAAGLERAVFELARRQHGVFGRGQLVNLGLSEEAIDHRIRAARLHVVRRGVYGLGPLHSKLAHWMAAVLHAGPGAVLSHRSAAELWALISGFTAPIHITASSARRQRKGLRFHRPQCPDDERTTVDGISVTTVPRTLLDCAPMMSARRLERMINEADVLRLHDRLSIADLLHRYPSRPGCRKLSEALRKRNAGSTRTRSEIEELLVELVDELGLRRPAFNVQIEVDGETFEIDALWRAERIAVELDSRQFHDTPLAFERDRRRDRKLVAAGWRPVRLTGRQLTEERAAVGGDLAAMLAAAQAA